MSLVSIFDREENHKDTKDTKIFSFLCVFVSLWFFSFSSVFYYFFYICGGLLLIQGLIALRGGFHYLSYVRASMRRAPKEPEKFTPRVALIAPCKGLDNRMGDYLRSL